MSVRACSRKAVDAWASKPHLCAMGADRDRGESDDLIGGQGGQWRIGTDPEVEWIREATYNGLAITSAIPPVFSAYATIVVPDDQEARSEQSDLVLRLLGANSDDQPWWLGYLDTGADDTVFPTTDRVHLYADWPYVLVRAGLQEALRWRRDRSSLRAPGPDLVFPANRAWLLSRLWDDDWRCLGGPTNLVDSFLRESTLEVRSVRLDEDATPPGHMAR
jgi:hypothetical protein